MSTPVIDDLRACYAKDAALAVLLAQKAQPQARAILEGYLKDPELGGYNLARPRVCTHLVLEVVENNGAALAWYRARDFYKLDATIFMAQKVPGEPDLLPPRRLKRKQKVVPEVAGSPNNGPMPEAAPARAGGRKGRAAAKKGG